MDISVLMGGIYIEVPTHPCFEQQDDSYHDEYGLVKFPPYMAVMEFEFDEADYTPDEVIIIKKHIYDNFEWLSDHALKYHLPCY